MTFPTAIELLGRRARLKIETVIQSDREVMAVALIAQSYSSDRARELVIDLSDDDGALQMLARHRIAAAGKVDADGNDLVTMADDDLRQMIASAFSSGCYAVHFNYQEDRDPDFTEAGLDYALGVHPRRPT